jgi:hypothetical protein
MTCEEEVEV